MAKTQYFKKFCEYSELSFTFGSARRYKEGMLKRESDKRYAKEATCGSKCCGWLHCSCCNCCYCCSCGSSSKYWFIVTSDFIVYLPDMETSAITEIILFDSSFKIVYDHESTGRANSIMLKNRHKEVTLRARDEIEHMIWVRAIEEAFNYSEWSSRVTKPFSSFAPERFTNKCAEVVDGKDYFETVYEALKAARRTVFVTDWWISPKLYLKRPVALEKGKRDESCRLDNVLKEIADRGVKVYVLIYKEVSFATSSNSKYAKKYLNSLSPNIQATRHPNALISFWSHHEKLLVVDHEIVLMGGIDLSYGRADVQEHPLADLPDENGMVLFPGQDFFNERIADFEKVDDPEYSPIDRYSQPKLPWHDVAVKIEGPVAKDFVMHFVQYWNHAVFQADGKLKKGRSFIYPVYYETDEVSAYVKKSDVKEPLEEIVTQLLKVG